MEVDGGVRRTGVDGAGALDESAQSRPGTGQSRGGGAAAAAGAGVRQSTENNIFNLQSSAVNDLLGGINIAGFGLNLDTLEFDTSESGQSSSVCMSPATAAEVTGSRTKISSAMSPAGAAGGAAAAGSSQNPFAGMTSRSLNSLSLKKGSLGASGSRGIDAKGGPLGGSVGGSLGGAGSLGAPRASSLNAAPSGRSQQDPGAGTSSDLPARGGAGTGGGGGGGSEKERAQGRPAGWHVGLELLPLDTPIGDLPAAEVFENSGKRSRVALSHIRTSSGGSLLPESEQKQLLEFARSSGILGNSPGGAAGGSGTPGGGGGLGGAPGGSNCSSARTLSPALSTESGRSGGGRAQVVSRRQVDRQVTGLPTLFSKGGRGRGQGRVSRAGVRSFQEGQGHRGKREGGGVGSEEGGPREGEQEEGGG
ncbi:hypothetical protein CLOP_g24152 [Closterium sp. NIES-67]|nr:hypothetical protein CLOP_g24152 [Closterium sp. NIES-67]